MEAKILKYLANPPIKGGVSLSQICIHVNAHKDVVKNVLAILIADNEVEKVGQYYWRKR